MVVKLSAEPSITVSCCVAVLFYFKYLAIKRGTRFVEEQQFKGTNDLGPAGKWFGVTGDPA